MEEPILELLGLTRKYGNEVALNCVTQALPAGKIIGLLGPNGSGKTTLIKLLAGLLTPTEGRVLVCGHPIGPESKALVSYLPERNSLPLYMNPVQLADYFAAFFADFDREAAIARLNRLEVPLRKPIKAMSKGTREKVQLVLVMSRRARLYLLDEPLGGVDPAARDFILDTILTEREPGATMLISTHLIHDVEGILDEYLFLQRGQFIRYGNARTVQKETGKTLEDLFREDFRC